MLRLEPGSRLDRYELLGLLAQGGMANVWLARLETRAGFRKLVAIKTILPHVAHDPSFKSMFLDEARIASQINHPNVVRMVDVGEFSGIPYLVMELVEGEPLFRLPKTCERLGHPMPLGVILRIVADACYGLHAAHELRGPDGQLLHVVHRDMSPQNILVSSAGVSLVIDFGVAKALDRSAQQTTAGTLKGKISYMPPEQARGGHVDRRADTWALGAVLYYLLSGRPPYKEDSQLATLQLAMAGATVPPLSESLPSSLRSVVMRALSQDPEERYQTAHDLGEDVESLMHRLAVPTTHQEVGAFVEQILADRLVKRRQLVANAVAQAAQREKAEGGNVPEETVDTHQDLSSSAPMPPSAVSSGGTPHEPSTAGAFVAYTPPQLPELPPPQPFGWATFAAAGAAGVCVAGLIVLALVTLTRKDPAATAATRAPPSATAIVATTPGTPATNAAPPPAPMPPPPPAAAEPPAAAPEPVSPAPPSPPPVATASATTSPRASREPRESREPVRTAPTRPPRETVHATPASTPAPSPPTTPRKRRDDEAGF
jgi:serine/threonine-protein kinase